VRIARGGGVIVTLAVGLAAAAVVLLPRLQPGAGYAALAALILPLLVLYFFRDPERTPAGGIAPGTAVAPADGRVIAVESGSDTVAVHIYLRLHDLHVIRLPLTARVESMKRTGRGFRPARSRGAAGNHRLRCSCSTEAGVMQVDLVAGLIARRIVPYLAPGTEADRGTRLGLIRFGSRVECRFPPGYRSLVRPGDRIRAGRTIIAVPASREEEE